MPERYEHEIPSSCVCHMEPGIEGEFYRIVKNEDGVTLDDFVPVAFSNPGRLQRTRKAKAKCRLYSVSIFSDYNEVLEAQDEFPLLGDYIAKACLSNDMGDHIPPKDTSKSHRDWFPYKGIDFLNLFCVVRG